MNPGFFDKSVIDRIQRELIEIPEGIIILPDAVYDSYRIFRGGSWNDEEEDAWQPTAGEVILFHSKLMTWDFE